MLSPETAVSDRPADRSAPETSDTSDIDRSAVSLPTTARLVGADVLTVSVVVGVATDLTVLLAAGAAGAFVAVDTVSDAVLAATGAEAAGADVAGADGLVAAPPSKAVTRASRAPPSEARLPLASVVRIPVTAP